MSTDATDDFLEHCVSARERGLSRVESKKILRDVYNTPREFAVSPCRNIACASPTHDNATDTAGLHGLTVVTGSDASAKATMTESPHAFSKRGGDATLSVTTEKAARPVQRRAAAPVIT